MQTSRTNFTTEQKVDFIIKIIEQQVPPFLWRHYCCLCATQHCNRP